MLRESAVRLKLRYILESPVNLRATPPGYEMCHI